MSETLPNSWTRASLLDIADLIRGVTYSKADAVDKPSSGTVPVLRATNIQNRKLLLNELVYVPRELVNQNQMIRRGDIVIATSSGSIDVVGKAAQATGDFDAAFGAFCGLLRAKESIDPRYLGHFLQTAQYRDLASSLARGVNINNLKRSHFEQIEIPLAPLSEQKSIADKLDRLLAAVDTCKARLDAIPAIIKRFRQSVLAAAVSGELTEEWRSRTGSAKAWETFSLKHLCSRVSVGHVGETSRYYTTVEDGGIPFLRSQNVRPGRVSLEGLNYITREFHEKLKKSQLKAGDLLVVRVGANRGDACVLPDGFGAMNCANIVFARPKSVVPAYLNLFVQSPRCREDLLDRSVGGAQGVINTRSVEQIQIDVPPKQEQIEIARRVQELLIQAQHIEAECDSSRARMQHLTQSLLAKGFRGGLEQRDEQTGVLLALRTARKDSERRQAV